MTELTPMLEVALAAIETAHNLTEIEAVKVRYVGKKGELTQAMQALGALTPEERKLQGQALNTVKQSIMVALNAKQQQLEDEVLASQLAKEAIDVTLPGRGQVLGALHPITLMQKTIANYFSQLGFTIASGDEIEDEYHNFDALNIPAHHPARAMHDTFYFPDGYLLRTHTSPVQIRYMKEHEPPIHIIAPGRVYRYESDLTHTPMFHQIEGLVVTKDASFAELKALLQDFMNQLFGKSLPMRFRPSFFPFTEPSAEADIACVACDAKGCRICKQTGWLEVLGCGMVHPKVLENAGINANDFRGFAFGMGVDRLAMLRYQIHDLRALFENDLRLLRQFTNV